MLRSLPERQALNYAAARPRGLDLILSLSGSMPDAIPIALDGVIRSRALVLDEIAARQRAAGRGVSKPTDPERVALTSAQQRLANLAVRGPGPMSPAQYTALLQTARRDSELAEQALAERSAEFRTERSRAQIGLGEVKASLPTDARSCRSSGTNANSSTSASGNTAIVPRGGEPCERSRRMLALSCPPDQRLSPCRSVHDSHRCAGGSMEADIVADALGTAQSESDARPLVSCLERRFAEDYGIRSPPS